MFKFINNHLWWVLIAEIMVLFPLVSFPIARHFDKGGGEGQVGIVWGALIAVLATWITIWIVSEATWPWCLLYSLGAALLVFIYIIIFFIIML